MHLLKIVFVIVDFEVRSQNLDLARWHNLLVHILELDILVIPNIINSD